MAKYTKTDLEAAVDVLATIPYFPPSDGGRAAVMLELRRMVPSKEALEWLASTAARKCKAWPGLGELRGLLCWKFPPADGQEEMCSIAGFTWMDGENQAIEESKQLKAGGWVGERTKGTLTPAGATVKALLEGK